MSRRKEAIRQIWMVSREYGNLAGAGGIKDVVSQLAATLAAGLVDLCMWYFPVMVSWILSNWGFICSLTLWSPGES